MKWILIAAFLTGADNTTHGLEMQEFDSETTCNAAAKKVEQLIELTDRQLAPDVKGRMLQSLSRDNRPFVGYRPIYTSCVKK